MSNFFIYAANLHVGGAVQVAVSVIDELSKMSEEANKITLLVSSQIDRNLRSLGVFLQRFSDYRVEDHHGLFTLFKNVSTMAGSADAIFVLFGPFYKFRSPLPVVVGFAQPWIIYPNNEIYSALTPLERWKTKVKFLIQSLFFKNADMLVVELDHVKVGLAREGIADEKRITVVHNCLSRLYFHPERWQKSPLLGKSSAFKLGFIGRNYSHKNTGIIPNVRKILLNDFGVDVKFYVTFTDEEWSNCSRDFRASVVNVGRLDVAQCPAFYQQLDGVFFPSVLECFSATPLEAMAMKRPLFVSDRPFNRDICGDLAFYFDPFDARSAAVAVAAYVENKAKFVDRLNTAYYHVMAMPGPSVRANRYLDCLRSVVAQIN